MMMTMMMSITVMEAIKMKMTTTMTTMMRLGAVVVHQRRRQTAGLGHAIEQIVLPEPAHDDDRVEGSAWTNEGKLRVLIPVDTLHVKIERGRGALVQHHLPHAGACGAGLRLPNTEN